MLLGPGEMAELLSACHGAAEVPAQPWHRRWQQYRCATSPTLGRGWPTGLSQGSAPGLTRADFSDKKSHVHWSQQPLALIVVCGAQTLSCFMDVHWRSLVKCCTELYLVLSCIAASGWACSLYASSIASRPPCKLSLVLLNEHHPCPMPPASKCASDHQ